VARRQQAIPKGTASGWLTILAEGEDLSPDFLVRLNYPTAHDLMSAPVITLHEETNLREIAQILTRRRIKSVPVVRDGRIAGIVSRADLVCALVVAPHLSVLQGRV
jgi:CBS-domain-containing membrane protein